MEYLNCLQFSTIRRGSTETFAFLSIFLNKLFEMGLLPQAMYHFRAFETYWKISL